ncbi:MAG: hypothetical protein LBG24_02135 [Treponema sp.]|jgi:predicted DNA-binding helix-hairpin-helix protein|nr:hypothetical protein [Treponema sp.]
MAGILYSAFIPVGRSGEGIPDARLPDISGPPLLREHRLYQADWLLRFYHFKVDEILDPAASYLGRHLDPKTAWAIRHLDQFPLEVSAADYEALLRVPGIGAVSGRRIIETRRSRSLTFDGIHRLGVMLKRARYFITLAGNFLDRPEDPHRLSVISFRMLTAPVYSFLFLIFRLYGDGSVRKYPWYFLTWGVPVSLPL